MLHLKDILPGCRESKILFHFQKESISQTQSNKDILTTFLQLRMHMEFAFFYTSNKKTPQMQWPCGG